MEERGVSSIIAFIIVMGLFMFFFWGVLLKEEMPIDWEEDEYRTMTQTKNNFMSLRSRIQGLENGQVSTTELKTGTPAPTALITASSSAIVNVAGARYVDDAEDVYYYDDVYGSRYQSTYVSESSPNENYQSSTYDNDHLYVSTTEGNRMRTYLKFDLSDTRLYDSYTDYEFEDDVEIQDVRLLLYCSDVDLVDDPSDVAEVAIPSFVELWAVENSAWGESITWSTQPHTDNTENRDRKLDNTDIDGEEEWVSWGEREDWLTNYVREKFEKIRGWGKWYQTRWYESTAPLLENSQRYSSDEYGYSKFYDSSDVDLGSTLTGTGPNGELTSSVFDAKDNNAYWNYISWNASDIENTRVWVRFDNDADFASPTDWENIIDGENNYAYLENYGRYAQYRVSLSTDDDFYDITLEYTYHLTFVLREPEEWGTSTLQNQIKFHSADNRDARIYERLTPRLRITYSRTGRIPSTSTTTTSKRSWSIMDLGYVEYRSQNYYFGDQNYIYEGGMVISQRYSWYDVVLAWPEDLVEIIPADGNKVQINVTRYQIEPSSIGGETVGGTGHTCIRVQREEEKWLVKPTDTPNRKEVTITISTDHPAPWRDYLEYLAARANYVISGYEDWDTYGDYATYDYDSVSLTIHGRDRDLEDIYYSERVVWLDTTTGYFQGGRS